MSENNAVNSGRETFGISLYPEPGYAFEIIRPFLAKLLESMPTYGTFTIECTTHARRICSVTTSHTQRVKPDRVPIIDAPDAVEAVESEAING